MTGIDPLGSRRLIAGALGGVLFWRFVAHMAGLPPMVGTAVGLAAPLTHAIESRSSARLPAPLKSAVNVAGIPGSSIGSWAYPVDMADQLDAPDAGPEFIDKGSK